MANEQSRPITTLGELKREIQQLPDDIKVSWGAGAVGGIVLKQDQGRVMFNQAPAQT